MKKVLNFLIQMPAYRTVCGIFLAIVCLLFLCASVPQERLGLELRLPATDLLRVSNLADIPLPIDNLTSGEKVWAIRAQASLTMLNPALAEAAQLVFDAPRLAKQALEHQPGIRKKILTPLLFQDGVNQPGLFALAPVEYADALDTRGVPIRWHMPGNVIAGFSKPRPMPFAPLAPAKETPETINPRYAKALARLAPAGNAKSYRAIVDSFAKKFNLNTNLVMAIIHSESNFSPRIVSRKSAMGLMQLMPSTASDEVHRFLYGRRGKVSFEDLANPEINIRYGTAYLHILTNRYFANVRDSHVREVCVIASYNMGPNGFLKLYGPNQQRAVEKINSMSSEEFHADLPKRLPVRETRFYVAKVKRMKQQYANMQ